MTQPVQIALSTTAGALNLDGNTAKVVIEGHIASGFETDPFMVSPGQTKPFKLVQKTPGEIAGEDEVGREGTAVARDDAEAEEALAESAALPTELGRDEVEVPHEEGKKRDESPEQL
jgi:hypothetical protein